MTLLLSLGSPVLLIGYCLTPKYFGKNQIDALDPDNFSTAFSSADWVRF
jgi:hypothetical protein